MTPEEEAARWPEHAKLKGYDGSELSAMAGFITWLEEHKGLWLGEHEFDGNRGDLIPAYQNAMELALEYVCAQLGVDREKLNAETRDMYRNLQDHPYFNK